MNESGCSSRRPRGSSVAPGDVLVVHDDVDLDGSAAGQGGPRQANGLRSIATALGTQDFLRLRIGVGDPPAGDRRPVADYVLSPFEPEDDADAIVASAADAVESLVVDGLDATQRRFNWSERRAARQREPASRAASIIEGCPRAARLPPAPFRHGRASHL